MGVVLAGGMSVIRPTEWFKKRAFNVVFFGVVQRLPLGLGNRIVSGLYDLINERVDSASSEFTNYGYALAAGQPGPEGVAHERRYDYLSRQLYRTVVGSAVIEGKDVLEVGCGRGGGAAYVTEQFGPRSVIGVDLSDKAIQLCNREYQLEGLTFRQGSAESLPFPDGAFDIVLNVESSHTYPSMPKFLAEVRRVLRPDGLFLITDFRRREDIAVLRNQFAGAGLSVRRAENITPNVLMSLDLTSEAKTHAFRDVLPRRRRVFLENFAAVKGSEMYRSLAGGTLQYWCFELERAAAGSFDGAGVQGSSRFSG
jgi:ubiquinone/menaquinone biosynthesis C-methylase UbiE